MHQTGNTFLTIQKFDICDGDISKCHAAKKLTDTILKYNNNNDIHDVNNYNIIDVINSFHHLLLNHDINDDYEYIFNLFGGNCALSNCLKIRSQYNHNDILQNKMNILDRRI